MREKDKGKPKRKWRADIAYTTQPLQVFDDPACGVQPEYQLPEDAPEADYFTYFFDGEIVFTACKETNRYAASLIVDPECTKKKELASWVGATIGLVQLSSSWVGTAQQLIGLVRLSRIY